jgi:uracil-DNA glycosylase family 4
MCLQTVGRAVDTEPRNELAVIVEQTVDYLNWLKDEGLSHVEVSRKFSGIADKPQTTQHAASTTGKLNEDKQVSRKPQKPVSPQVDELSQVSVAPPKENTAPKLAVISAEISHCTKCGLHKTRTNTVPGQGNNSPEIMFVGEAPGADEDAQGLAFVGAAGQLLTKMIEAMGLSRDEVFIANILKCRPPDNRRPTPEEMQTCIPYLKEQIKTLKPRVIVALGATAVHGLLAVDTGISKLRGQWHKFEGIDVMPTFHPAYLLRNPTTKREAWEDLKSVLRHVGKTPPAAKKQG